MLRIGLPRSYSALSKRTNKVKVQLLKDFPKFQLYKGQVASVSPSLMRNYLHSKNGARYILADEDIDQQLQAKAFELTALRVKEVAKKDQDKMVVGEQPVEEKETSQKEEIEKKKQPKLFNSGITLKDVKIPGLEI
ncbi:LAFA_0F13960g1_1 [Lachancea sp. 'fantastica']|nr:LAFA_0F13960g1_1 [Lachancea sp. 'fantastica']